MNKQSNGSEGLNMAIIGALKGTLINIRWIVENYADGHEAKILTLIKAGFEKVHKLENERDKNG